MYGVGIDLFRPFGADAYGVLGLNPELVADFDDEYYRAIGTQTTFSDLITHARAGQATMTDSDGLIKWAPHNLVLNSESPATQTITVISGIDYTVECTGVSVVLSGAGTGAVTEGNPLEITASTTSLTLTVTGSTGTLWCYRSDLGGMVDNPDRGDSYVPTTSSAVYLPRRGHHVYNGSEFVNEGVLAESEARTNLLHTTNALVTQSYNVTAVPHTLHFTGTGTITLSGASTDGPLVGTGTGEENRVYLTFTPTAASLTLTVSGTVTDAQLEIGSTPSSYIPNLAGSGTVTRAAETFTIPSAKLPWPTPKYIGSELVTNGDFSTNSDWIKDANWTIASGVATSTTSAGGIYQAITCEVGKVYFASIDITSAFSGGVVGVFQIRNSTNVASIASFAINDGTTGTKTVAFVATETTHLARVYVSGTAGAIDNISVREINPLSVSIQMDGRMTYADEDNVAQVERVYWYANSSNNIRLRIATNGGNIGQPTFTQVASGTADAVVGATDAYSPNILVPYNLASRHGSTFINGAVEGVSLTADTTPVALPDLSSTNLSLAYTYMGTIKTFRIWDKDLGDTGIAEATS